MDENSKHQPNKLFNQVTSATFCFIASFITSIVINDVLSHYGFPAFQILGVGQNLTIIISLWLAKMIKIVDFPDIEYGILKKMLSLSVIHLFNMITTLGAWKELGVSQYSAIRSFSIILTLILEIIILHKRHSTIMLVAVCIMISGAIMVNDDEKFNQLGFSFAFPSIVFTSLHGVYIKKTIDSNRTVNIFGLMFYSALLSIVPGLFIAYETGEFKTCWSYELWITVEFQVQFVFACELGFIFLSAVCLCTQQNSALTTASIGCLKNICMICLGLDLGGYKDYSWVNMLGVAVCAVGCLVYLYESRENHKNYHVEEL